MASASAIVARHVPTRAHRPAGELMVERHERHHVRVQILREAAHLHLLESQEIETIGSAKLCSSTRIWHLID